MSGIRLALAALLLAPAAAEVKAPETYTYLSIAEPNSLDPAWAYDNASQLVILNVYEPLFAYDGPSTERLAPLIAAKVPSRANGLISADGRTYRIPIRKGVSFHDGSALTPEDVRYSILRFLLADREAGPSSLLLEPLLGYPSTRDDRGQPNPQAFADASKAVRLEGDTLVLTLPKPFAPLLTILASWSSVVSKDWAVKNGDWDGSEESWRKFNNRSKQDSPFFERANGTGPFRLERWDRRVQQIMLARNDAYWRPPAHLSRVVIRSVKEFGTRKLSLQAGDADVIHADRPSLSQLARLPGTRVIDDLPAIALEHGVFFTFSINTAGNPFVGSGKLDGAGVPPEFFADKDVRKAFAYAFDYQGFLRDVNRGKGTQATGCIPKGLPGHNPAQKTYALDLDRARRHFQKALGGQAWEKGFQLTIAYKAGNAPRDTIARILKRNIEDLNPRFRIDVRGVEWPTLLDALRAGKVPMFLQGWSADYPDPHNFAFPVMHSKGGFPRVQRYKNARADELIERAMAEVEPARRKALYRQLQEIEHEDVPHLLIVDPVNFRVERDWVRGWEHNPIFPDSPAGSCFYPISKGP